MNISYVYRITHKQTSKWYIGSRTASVDPLDDLGIRYFTSGTASEEFKNNPDSFTREILFTHESREVVNAEESRLIDETDAVSDPMAFNIANWPLACDPVKAAASGHSVKDENGRSKHAIRIGTKSAESGALATRMRELATKQHSEKSEDGRSKHAIRIGKAGAATLNSEKDDMGRSLAAIKGGNATAASGHLALLSERLFAEKLPDGRSVYGVMLGKKGAAALNSVKDNKGRSIAALKGGLMAAEMSLAIKPIRKECQFLCKILGVKLGINGMSGKDKFESRLAQLQAMLSSKETANG